MRIHPFAGLPANLFTSLIIALLMLYTTSAFAQTDAKASTATFAGGCFWCIESDFDKVEGVLGTTSGFMGGKLENPSYKEVSAGGSGHREVVQIHFDPHRVTYAELITKFLRSIDPVDADGQFCDRGFEYTSAVFFHDEEQRSHARSAIDKLNAEPRFKDRIATQVLPATDFYAADEGHQNYHQKNPLRYKFYRYTCGRDQRLEELWGPTETINRD